MYTVASFYYFVFTTVALVTKICQIFSSRYAPIFYISDITNSSSFNGKIFRKKSTLEKFRANALKL